jgi:exopolysaccharide biosynthesis polyprenyl glycosylphosphotransferase
MDGTLLSTSLARQHVADVSDAAHVEGETRLPRRGWLVRRALGFADICGLALAFFLSEALFGSGHGHLPQVWEVMLVGATVPGWLITAQLYGLYEADEERTDHSTVDEFFGVFHLVTVGVWLLYVGAWLTQLARPDLPKLVVFWVLATAFVSGGRGLARALCRRSPIYLQNTIIVGAGDVGQLIARKVLQHPEYGLNIVGFVDTNPKIRAVGLDNLRLVGDPAGLRELVDLFDVERVIVAFSNDSHDELIGLIRSLRDHEVQVDIVPRLFDVMSPRARFHDVEGLPVVGLRPVRLSRSSQLIKRATDLAGASIALLLTAPLFAVIALLIKRDSKGPVFFRQSRLGLDMREFTALKFRTMQVDTDASEHERYIASTMDPRAPLPRNGLFKLERRQAVTQVGSWLRRTSLDELPQLINVLRGDMSLVGPRPCLEYETRYFEEHHFERFFVPAGITGLWQVTARARSTFREALDMDVAYARGWSLGLDLRLLARTPFALLRQKASTA